MRLPTLERQCTMAFLRRFFRMSLLVGRMPSVLGREIFAARMPSASARGFEDAVVLVCDVERCLRSLDTADQRLLAYCVFEDRSEWEAARLFRQSQAETSRRLAYLLDVLYDTFCRLGLLPRVRISTPDPDNIPIHRVDPRRRKQ